MANYAFEMPPKVLYGYGCVERLKDEMPRLHMNKVLLMTDSFIATTPSMKILTDVMDTADVPYVVYDKINSEPTDVFVDEALDMYRKEGCDGIVALGGGSTMDAAKGVAVMATHPGNLVDYEGINKFTVDPAPLIAITTTAGTGSEVSKTMVLSIAATSAKLMWKDARLRPIMAVCDAQFTMSLPKSQTAQTGYDSLAHAVEAYVSVNRTPMSDVAALESARLIFKYLVRSYNNPDDVEAREGMLLAEMLGGVAFGNASTASAHGLARPFGGFFHVPHGLSVSIFLPEVIKFNMDTCPERYKDLAVAMGSDVTGLSDYDAGMLCYDAIMKMREDLNIPTISELGIDLKEYEEKIPAMVDAKAKNHGWNPKTPTRDELIELYRSVMR